MPTSGELRAWLERHEAADAVERGYIDSMLGLLDSAGDAFSRAHFHPGHFTASAFVLSPECDALLLIHHRKLARWLQPGGHVEKGDPDLLASARREVAEEVGVLDLSLMHRGVFDVDVHAIPERPGEPGHFHFDVRFLFRAGSRALQRSDEVAAARWVPLSELDEHASDASVMRAVEKVRPRLAAEAETRTR